MVSFRVHSLPRLNSLVLAVVVVASSVLFAGCNPLTIKQKAGLQVITNDVPAVLFLDGQYLDRTPYIAKDIKPGTYTLRIEPEDTTLVPYETSITLRKGLLSVVLWRPGTRPELSGGVMYEMEKLPNSKETELSLVTIPDRAIVRIDGENKGFSPTSARDITPGQHEFEVSLPSYETQKHTLNMVAGHHITVTVKLAKLANAALDKDPSMPDPNPTASPAATASSSATATTSGVVKGVSTSSGSRALEIGGPRIKIESTNFFYNGQESLRVRATPANNGTELGFAPVGSEYPYLNEKQNGWFKIKFNSQEGWVSGQFAKLLPQ